MRLSRKMATTAGIALVLGLLASTALPDRPAFAQAPASPTTTAPPAADPAPAPPATPPLTPTSPSTPAPSAQTPASPPAPAAPPAAAAPPAKPPAAAAAPEAGKDVFGEEVTLTAKTYVYFSGSATWDKAFETIQKGLGQVNAYLKKQGIAADGPPTTVYTSTDDSGFNFRVGVPVAQAPSPAPTGDLGVGQTPAGKALKYIHRGSYDAMDSTYEAITNQLDDKGLEAQDLFVEVYLTDPLTTPEDKLVIEVYVPLR